MSKKVCLLLLFILTSCSSVVRKPSSTEEQIWYRAVEKVLRYLPTDFTREELLQDKQKLYRMMGAIELNQSDFEGKNIAMIPSRFFSGELKERFLQPHGEQLPYDQWDGTENWGIQFSLNNLKEPLRSRIAEYPNQTEIINAIFRGDEIINFNDRFYLLPELSEVPRYILEASRARFVSFDNESLEDWADQFFNVLPKREFSRSREYFSAKNLFPDQKQMTTCESTIRFQNNLRGRNRTLNRFIAALEDHKPAVQRIMGISNDFYNELAALTIGVLLVESNLGRSLRYWVKEFRFVGVDWGQGLVNLLKNFTGESGQENSRGLTQIKILEDMERWVKDTEYEYLLEADYRNAEDAALATMFTLREKLNHLQNLQDNHTNIDEHNWPDYLYYPYSGAYGQISRGLATPNLNIKIRKIIEFRKMMYIFENCEAN